jgi:hypothetical protein
MFFVDWRVPMLAAAVFLVTALATACGDDDKPLVSPQSSTTSTSLSNTPEDAARAVVRAVVDKDWASFVHLTRPDLRTTPQAEYQLGELRKGDAGSRAVDLSSCGPAEYLAQTDTGDVRVYATFPEPCANGKGAGECAREDTIVFEMEQLGSTWFMKRFKMGGCGYVWIP